MGSNHVPSLQCLCVSVIAVSLEDAVSELGDAASLLPLTARAQLLAVARRRRCLSDSLLCLFAGPGMPTLDVSKSRRVTDASVASLARDGYLLHTTSADLRGSSVSHLSSEALARGMPSLEYLRVGGDSSDAARGIASELCRPLREHDFSDWEELLSHPQQTLRPFPKLRFLVWPEAPDSALKHIQRARPGLLVLGARLNVLAPSDSVQTTSHPHVNSAHMPRCADLRNACDESLVSDLSYAALRPSPGVTEAANRRACAPLAQRFKEAYQSRRIKPERQRSENFGGNAKHARRSAAAEWQQLNLSALVQSKALHPTVLKRYMAD